MINKKDVNVVALPRVNICIRIKIIPERKQANPNLDFIWELNAKGASGGLDGSVKMMIF